MLAEKNKSNTLESSKICCPVFDPSKWDNVHHQWTDKLFLKDSVPELFHIPLPGTYKKTITRMWQKAEVAGAEPSPSEFLLLAHDPSAFKGELFMTITKEIPGAECVRLSGSYLSKVFEGNYNEVPRCIKEMNALLSSNQLISKKEYIYYPYCPNCAKKYGHNYIVVISEVYPL
jgi:hypothetical protein